MPPYRIEPLVPDHRRAAFSSGSPALDRYLREQAGQDMRRNVARVFVLCPDESTDVAGYYCLSAASLDYRELPPHLARRLPRYPVLPAVLLGRLAVDARYQGRGLGRLLLVDALRRSLRVGQSDIAAMAVVVDAMDEAAARFYERHEFVRLPDQPSRLILPMPTIARAFSSAPPGDAPTPST